MPLVIAHVHDWRPIEGETARYICATCPSHGRRPPRGGPVIEGLFNAYEKKLTARQSAMSDGNTSIAPGSLPDTPRGSYRVRRAPTK